MNHLPQTATIDEFFAEINEHEQAGRLEAASVLAEQMVEAEPQMAMAHSVAGLLAFRMGNFQHALKRIEKSIELAPQLAQCLRNATLVYHGIGRMEEALGMVQREIELSPQDPVMHLNKGLVLHDLQRFDEGLDVINQALTMAPDYAEANFQRAESQLLIGRFVEGWESYERRFELEQGKHMLPKTTKPQWDGKKLKSGRLLLVADQGYGDCIQFSRYIPWVAKLAPKPILATDDVLAPLLGQMKEIGRVAKSWDEAGDYDAYIPLSGLPRLAGTTLDTIPAPIPYLKADPQKVKAWQAKLAALLPPGLKRVGIIWAGRPTHLKDQKRSVKLAQFAPLFAREDLAIIALQKDDRRAEAGMYFDGPAPFLNLGPMIKDYNDTLAILQCLDHLVSIDTSVAHLAGASGVPTSLILPQTPDWRWLLGRDDTPWYPTMRLFRQERAADWSGVVERVAQSL